MSAICGALSSWANVPLFIDAKMFAGFVLTDGCGGGGGGVGVPNGDCPKPGLKPVGSERILSEPCVNSEPIHLLLCIGLKPVGSRQVISQSEGS